MTIEAALSSLNFFGDVRQDYSVRLNQVNDGDGGSEFPSLVGLGKGVHLALRIRLKGYGR